MISYATTNAWGQIYPSLDSTKLELPTWIHHTLDLVYLSFYALSGIDFFPGDGFDTYWVQLEGIQFST